MAEMAAAMAPAVPAEHAHEPAHQELGFWRKYVFSTDHKVIGKQFLFSSFFFFIVGGLLALLIRTQLAWPFQPLPGVGGLLYGESGGVMLPENYIALMTMHGTIMIFFMIIPILAGAFGNFLIPLMIGARDMAFPKLNMVSYWVMWPGFLLIMAGFLVETGAAASGWTSYPPLASVPAAGQLVDGKTVDLWSPGSGLGQTLWILAVICAGTSSIMGSINYITTISLQRAPGLHMFRLPLTIWALFITAILQLLATPVVTAGIIMLLLDRLVGTVFFTPVAAGHPLLFQHVFWFYSHPAVYIMILPAMGMVTDILTTFSRKPLFGYRPMVYAIAAIALLGFVVWGHHMFQSGMSPLLAMGFMTTTMLIAVPSGVKVFNWLATMWGGQLRFNSAMLFAVSFVALFIIGGLSGLFMAATPVDIYIHDTYFIVAHLHYVLFASSVMGVFAGIYYWFPKMFGRLMNERWGKVHWLLTFVGLNGVFFPMHLLGIAGMPRRIADYTQYAFLEPLQGLNQGMTYSAYLLGAAQIIFFVNFFYCLRRGERAVENPWHANTLEWVAPSPPPHGNFDPMPTVYRGPYEYSAPGREDDYWPQWIPGPEPVPEHEPVTRPVPA
jgi:cytochrome c oxidase subunit 1